MIFEPEVNQHLTSKRIIRNSNDNETQQQSPPTNLLISQNQTKGHGYHYF